LGGNKPDISLAVRPETYRGMYASSDA